MLQDTEPTTDATVGHQGASSQTTENNLPSLGQNHVEGTSTPQGPSYPVPPPASLDHSIPNTIFTNEFIDTVARSLEDFGPELFRQETDINFERDFGQWFNPDEAMGLDGMGSGPPPGIMNLNPPPPLVELPPELFQNPPAPGMQAAALQSVYDNTLARMEGLSVAELTASSDPSFFDLSVPRSIPALPPSCANPPSQNMKNANRESINILRGPPGVMPMIGGPMSGMPTTMDNVNQEIMNIPQNALAGLKQETGVGDKEINLMTMPEKQRIIHLWRTRRGPLLANIGTSSSAFGI